MGLEKFSPTKIILDRNLITPLNSNIFLKPRRSRIIIFHNIKNNPKINLLRKKYDYVFTTGGIGPTHDDITAESVSKFIPFLNE